MKEIAIFGGTFDPPTKAHEAIIEACLRRNDIDEVWVVPSGDRVDKPHMQPADIRMQMLKTMHQVSFQNTGRVVLSSFELTLPQPTQTYTSVRKLQDKFPDNHFWYVFGADSYLTMPDWNKGKWLQRNLGMLLVRRHGYELPQETDRLRHLDVNHFADEGISSSLVRRLIQNDELTNGLVSEAVLSEIKAQNLYSTV